MDRIDGMRTFVAVVQSGSFTGAGQRLGITNKLVSKYIGTLETRLGVKLLHRTTRSQSLTNEGRSYLEGCQKVLGEFEALNLMMDPSGGFSGLLRITAPLTFGETVIPAAAMEFMDAHPDVTIEIDLNDGHVDLAKGGYDLAIRMGVLKDSSLIALKLGSTEFMTVAAPSYIKRHGMPSHPDDLASHNCILDTNNPDPNHWPYFINGQMVQTPVSGSYIANSPPACLAPTYAGKGIYNCPEIFLGDDLKVGRLVRLLTGFPSRTLDIHAVRLPSASKNPKVTAFVGILRDQLKRGLQG